MATQELVQFRVDADLKKDATAIYNQLGLDLPTACRMFLARTKLMRGIPFELTIPEEKLERATNKEAVSAFMRMREQVARADVPEMTLEEINEDITEARRNIKKKKEAKR